MTASRLLLLLYITLTRAIYLQSRVVFNNVHGLPRPLEYAAKPGLVLSLDRVRKKVHLLL